MMPVRMSISDIIYIGLGGILGSLLRWWIGLGFEGSFPAPTFLVNILGATALGILYAAQHRLALKGKYLYMVGFCGSFTTGSLFTHETIVMLESGDWSGALLNLALPVAIALAAVAMIIGPVGRAIERARE